MDGKSQGRSLGVPGTVGLNRRATGGVEEKVLVPHLGWISLDAGDELATLLRQGYFEATEQAFAWLYLRPGDWVLDCGAHVGLYSVLASRATAGAAHVVAFEPNPPTARLLEQNLARNAGGTAQVRRTAIWNREGTVRFDGESSGRAAYAHVAFEPVAKVLEVEATTIDRAVESTGARSIALLKLDVEGAEPEAIEGAAASIASGSCQVLLVEFTEANLQRRGWSTARLGDLLRHHGLSLFEFSAERLELVPCPSTEQLWFRNLIATRDPEAVQARLLSASPANLEVARDILARASACDRLRELEDLDRLRKEAAERTEWANRAESMLSQARQEAAAIADWARRAEAEKVTAREEAAANADWARRVETLLAEERALSEERRLWAESTERLLAAERSRSEALLGQVGAVGQQPRKD